MPTSNLGIGAVLQNLIEKTRGDEIKWEETPVLNSYKVTVDNLEFHVESLQDEEEKLYVYDLSETAPIPGVTVAKGKEVLGPKALGGFTYREEPQIRILMRWIQNKERQSPEYQRRMRKTDEETRERAKKREGEQKEAAQEIAKRYFS